MASIKSILIVQRLALVKLVPKTQVATNISRSFSVQKKPISRFAFNVSNCFLVSNRTNSSSHLPKATESYAKVTEKAVEAKSTTPELVVSTDPKLIVKQRPPLKKKPKQSSSESTTSSMQTFKVRAFATADYYDLDGLRASLESSGAYQLLAVDEKMSENSLCVGAKYPQINEIEPRHMFFFLEGTVVFWNLSAEEQNGILQMLHKHEKNPYPNRFVKGESEVMEYSWHHMSDDSLSKRPTRLVNSHIYFEANDDPNTHLLEKYAFSDAMSLSVKLGIWEKNLEEFSENIGRLTDELKTGNRLKVTSDDVLKNLGELLTMRHIVNLDSHFLESPDFYWDRESLEPLYSQLVAYLTIPKRTRLFNDKLNHCIDLMGIIKQHLSDKHHVRLEWIIIWLIFVEVLIGLDVFVLLKKSVAYLFGL